MVHLDRSGLLSTTKQWCAEDGARESYATSVSANGSPLFRGPSEGHQSQVLVIL